MKRNAVPSVYDGGVTSNRKEEHRDVINPSTQTSQFRSKGAQPLCHGEIQFPAWLIFMIKFLVISCVFTTMFNLNSSLRRSFHGRMEKPPSSTSSKMLRSEPTSYDGHSKTLQLGNTQKQYKLQDGDRGNRNEETAPHVQNAKGYTAPIPEVYGNNGKYVSASLQPGAESIMQDQQQSIEQMMQQIQEQQEVLNAQLAVRNKQNSMNELQEKLNQDLEQQKQWMQEKSLIASNSPIEPPLATTTLDEAANAAAIEQNVEQQQQWVQENSLNAGNSPIEPPLSSTTLVEAANAAAIEQNVEQQQQWVQDKSLNSRIEPPLATTTLDEAANAAVLEQNVEQQQQQMQDKSLIASNSPIEPPLTTKTLDAAANAVALEQDLKQQEQWVQENSLNAGNSPIEPQLIDATPNGAAQAAGFNNEHPGNVGEYPNAYKDTWEPFEENDTPVFWHIAKSGGSTIKDIMGSCHQMCLATKAGIQEGHLEDTEVARVRIGGDPDAGQEPSCFVNADTTKTWGIERSIQLGLIPSGLADGIIVRHLFEANALFDASHRGRLFALFRHPIDRAVSLFNYLQYADWELTYTPELAKMNIEEYAKSPIVENNSMVRFLVGGKMEGPVTEDDLEIAKDIVRRKFLVGTLDKKEQSMERFEKYFGWKYIVNPGFQEPCREKLLLGGSNPNKKKLKPPEPGTEAHHHLAHQNKYDIPLYEYIETLFEEQEGLVKDKADGFRLEGADCCECPPRSC